MGFAEVRARRIAQRTALAAGFVGLVLLLGEGGALAATDEHAGDHAINWVYGFFGEKEGLDHPNWMWRHPGMPVPLGAYLINTSILFYILYRVGRKPLMDGLRQRRQRIMQGMDEAGKMKAEAEAQLALYQAKLDEVDAEVTRIQKKMRESAEAERQHILADAKKRRERMEREAKQLIVQELKAAREQLLMETARNSMDSAQQLLVQHVNSSDHQRLSDEYVDSLKAALANSSRGQA